MHPLIHLKKVIPMFLIALCCFGLLSKAEAIVPAPDGGYPGGNTAEGQSALLSLTTGGFNTAVGYLSLRSDTTGSFNTAIGAGTLLANTADYNTAIGAGTLLSNSSGSQNTANGTFALFSNTTGASNTADGVTALFNNTTGNQNTANGVNALISNMIGSNNTANGAAALLSNTSGSQNTADGLNALESNTTGSNNTALGSGAGLGVTTADNVIAIGTDGANVSDSCFIGRIRGVTTANADAIPVLIDSAGQLGTMSSSRRFKKEIKPIDKASEAILAFKPVTFHYKSDNTGTPQFGLIAEEVAEVNPDLVVRDSDGEIYTVRYEAVNAMLLNEFLKEHKKVEQLESTVASLAATVKEQAAQFRKVSAQIEISKATPKVVLNNQ